MIWAHQNRLLCNSPAEQMLQDKIREMAKIQSTFEEINTKLNKMEFQHTLQQIKGN